MFFVFRTHHNKISQTPLEELTRIATPLTKQATPRMPTTRGSNSSGASAVAIFGIEQQEDPGMNVNPMNDSIDVDEDTSQTGSEHEVRHLCVTLWRSCDRRCTRSCSTSIIHPLWLSKVTAVLVVKWCVPVPVAGGLYMYVASCRVFILCVLTLLLVRAHAAAFT